ncbi:MAG: PQQ-binding-like beta-propeller repeat protein [Candidatus Eremiobacteraeota bacterium]|nr:PQQ-binding-like beta-propeller repeat protein [Candidatus Eremiobacteraeota bacterium]
MEIKKAGYTGSTPPSMKLHREGNQKEDLPPSDSVTVGSPSLSSELPSRGFMAASFRNAASGGPVSLDALSALFEQKSGPLWEVAFPGVHGSSGGMKLMEDGSLYGVGYKTLAKYDTARGQVAWQKEFDSEPSASYLTTGKDSTLLVMLGFDRLYGLDPSTGKEKWSYKCNKTGLWDPAPQVGPDGTIFTFRGERLVALTPDGDEKYSRKVGKYSPSIVGIDSSGTAIVTSGNDVMALSPKGKELWRADGRNSCFFPQDRDHVYIPKNEKLEVRNREKGGVEWERTPADLGISSVTLHGAHGGKLIVGDGQKSSTLLCLDTVTGKTLWESKAQGDERYVRMFPEEGMLTVKDGDKLQALDMEKGTPLWTLDIPAGAKLGPQALSPKGALFVQVGKTVYGLDAATGKPFSRNDGFGWAGDLQVAPDGTTVFTQEYGTLKMMALDGRSLEGKVQEAVKDVQAEQADAGEKAKISEEDDFIIIDGLRLDKGPGSRKPS